jgi:hypothetical protein
VQQSLAQEQDAGGLSPTTKLMQQNARLVVMTLEVRRSLLYLPRPGEYKHVEWKLFLY